MKLGVSARLALVLFTLTLSAGVAAAQEVRSWMNSEIGGAWSQGFKGQLTSITVIDDFVSNSRYRGDLLGLSELRRHGEWTALEAGMIAPSAKVYTHDFGNTRSVKLQRGLNTLNLSYGMMGTAGSTSVRWSQREASIIKFAAGGNAVVVKAAGNDAVAVGAANSAGLVDYLNRDLIGKQSVIFVGALDKNGTTDSKANLATYSNFAGTNPVVQGQFLTVGVRGDLTALYGTSFAAPVVSGYAAVLGSKFTKATPTQIANRLLDSARTDTIAGYDVSIHGQGEASITRALAPASIN